MSGSRLMQKAEMEAFLSCQSRKDVSLSPTSAAGP